MVALVAIPSVLSSWWIGVVVVFVFVVVFSRAKALARLLKC